MRRFVTLLALVLGVWLAPTRAFAVPAALVVHAHGPVELMPNGAAFSAKLVLENRGSAPLDVDVDVARGSDKDPRLPDGVSATFAAGSSIGALKPGERRELRIEWMPPRDRRLHELWGQVRISVEDDPVPAVVGFHVGPTDPGLGQHLLSFLILIPLLGALVLFALGGRGTDHARWRTVVVGVVGAQLLVLGWATSRFDFAFTRFDGYDGIQLVDRASLLPGLGLKWFLALDGLSLPFVLLVPVLLLSAVTTSPSTRHPRELWALACILDAALVGVLASFDLGVVLVFLVVAVVAVVLAVAKLAGARVARGLGLQLGAATLLLAFAVWQLSGTATPAHFPDGTLAPRVFDLTELAHGGYVARAATLFGVHPVKLIYGALFLGSAWLLAAPPLHGWLAGTVARVPAPLAILIAGGVTPLGAYFLVRVGYAALPDGSAWAAPALAALGVLGAFYAALSSFASRDLARFVGLAVAMQSGLVLLAVSSLTAGGVQAVVVLAVSRGLWVALLVATAAAVKSRLGTLSLPRLGGIAAELPVLGVLGAVAFYAAAGGPGTLGFLGSALSVVSAFPVHRALSLVALLALALAAAGQLRVFRRVFSGEFPEIWRQSPRLIPFGGKLPLPEERETTVLFVLVLLLLGLGLWPRPLLRLSDASALDQAEWVNPPGPLEVVERAPERGLTPTRLASASLPAPARR